METITITNESTTLATVNTAAYEAAKGNEFLQYMLRRANGTKQRHIKTILDFAAWYADDRNHVYTDMLHPAAWKDITAKDITDYRLNLIYNDSYKTLKDGTRENIGKKSINTVNQTISIICKYAKLAHAAGYVSDTQYNIIRDIEGITPNEATEIDNSRNCTRCINAKKSAPVQLTVFQMELLKHDHPNTLQGKRNQLVFCLLLDHGQRIGDMVNLKTDNVDMVKKQITFKTQKTNINMTLQMTADVYNAFLEYFAMYTPQPGGSIWTGTNKSDKPQGSFSKRAAQKMITAKAAAVGISDFSAHDCRHAWTDRALDAGNDLVTVQHAGGWKNLNMVSYYAAKKEVSNAGLKGFN